VLSGAGTCAKACRSGRSHAERACPATPSASTLADQNSEPSYPARKSPSKLDDYEETLTSWLFRESRRHRKQRRTARQLYRDLLGLGYTGSYDRVAAFARRWREEQQAAKLEAAKRTYVPLQFQPGEAFQFDWSEDWIRINGVSTKLQVAHFKLSYSRAYFMRAYLTQSHEMLFDAHYHAFVAFGGVPERGIYDNMKTAVDKVGRGKQRQVNKRFQAMVGHYLFEAEFCNPAAGWEKGQVEKAGARCPSGPLVGPATFKSLVRNSTTGSRSAARSVAGAAPPTGQGAAPWTTTWQAERDEPDGCPRRLRWLHRIHSKRVTSTCLISHEHNRYSVPASFANRPVSLRVYPERLVIVAEARVVADS
jgi:transposase